MIKIHKKLEWMHDYLDVISPMISKVDLLQEIYITRSSTKYRHKAEGLIYEYSKRYKRRFEIGLNIKWQRITFKPFSVKLESHSKLDLLSALAHELAHLYHWDHTVEHAKLELKIYNKFLTKLKKDGYISEEHELKILRRNYGKV